jgi:hypothetical protein
MILPPLPYAAPEPPPRRRLTEQGVALPPRAGAGRPKGATSLVSKTLKEAILYAAAEAGDLQAAQVLEEKGIEVEGGLGGYLVTVAMTDIKTFCGLLGRVLPMEVTGANGGAFEVVFKTVYEDAAPKLIG